MSNLSIRESVGKGRGVFAAREFSPGEMIESCPVIITKVDVQYDNLENYLFAWDKTQNQCAMVLGYGSLYNYSDTPNAYYSRNLENNTMEFYALHHIAADEEICTNYGGPPVWFEVH